MSMAAAATLGRLTTGLTWGAAACACMPWQPDVDNARYEAQMHWAFADGWRHGHDIADADRPFEQDDHARHEVGEDLLQPERQAKGQRGSEPLHLRPANPERRRADRDTDHQNDVPAV